ncbi:ABC transporter G family member 23-like [Haemaphysalis longicornis]
MEALTTAVPATEEGAFPPGDAGAQDGIGCDEPGEPPKPATSKHGKTAAVAIRGLELWYGSGSKKVDIFRGVNMTVPHGGIYALLGSSGCGKTTLLRCIMARKHFQKGTIRLFGLEPGTPGSKIPGANVGYMPQEVALFGAFTIEETLGFFARIYDLGADVVKARTEFLAGFLELPDPKRLVSCLSGGQKRRVSLAVSLIHSPPLLILDEPTVGIDPVLRMKIWTHMVALAEKEGMSIIITTHYIDEARLASKVAFLRHGQILAEEAPEELMRRHDTDNLEQRAVARCTDRARCSACTVVVLGNQVFLVLATQAGEEDRGGPTEAPAVSAALEEVSVALSFMASVGRLKLQGGGRLDPKERKRSRARIGAIFYKNVLKLRRSVAMLLYSFLLPSIEVSFFCAVIGNTPFGLNLAVVNEEPPPPVGAKAFSAEFLDHIDDTILPQVKFDDLDSALNSVRDGHAYGAIHLRKNITRSLEARYNRQTQLSAELIDFSSVHVYLDMSNQQVFMTMQAYLKLALNATLPDFLPNNNKLAAREVLVIEEPVVGSKTTKFSEFVTPGMIMTITYFMAVTACISSLLEEKSDGLLERCTVAGVRSSEVVLAHVASQIFIIVLQDLLMLFVALVVWQLPSHGSVFAVILITLLQGTCGMMLGLLISSLFDDPEAATLVSVGCNYPAMMISGILWPLEGIPEAVRVVSYVLPLTLPSEALRSVMSKGWGFGHVNVLLGMAVSAIWASVLLAATVLSFRQ